MSRFVIVPGLGPLVQKGSHVCPLISTPNIPLGSCLMTNSAEPSPKAAQTLERIFFLLEEKKIRREIEDPIDRISSSLQASSPGLLSLEEFHQTIADFVRKVYHYGLRFCRGLSASQARSEAIFVLEELYQGNYSRGCNTSIYSISVSIPLR